MYGDVARKPDPDGYQDTDEVDGTGEKYRARLH